MARLRITEIFYSLQGETRFVGLPTVFIRTTGCPLRCGYCDTSYAFQGGNWLEISEILAEVAKYAPRYITLTGGEPLAQKNSLFLLTELCDAGYTVSLETSGAIDVSGVDPRVCKILDIKTPASKESDKNLFENLQYVNSQDQIKFVICDRQDYDWAKQIIQQYQMETLCEILFSPSFGQLSATDLANWILNDKIAVRLQIQLHKFLWGNAPGR